MSSKAVKDEDEYEGALKEIERLWNTKPGTPDGVLLDDLIDLVESYEDKHHPIARPKEKF